MVVVVIRERDGGLVVEEEGGGLREGALELGDKASQPEGLSESFRVSPRRKGTSSQSRARSAYNWRGRQTRVASTDPISAPPSSESLPLLLPPLESVGRRHTRTIQFLA